MYAIGQAARLYFTGGGFYDIILVTFGANISVHICGKDFKIFV